jgi:Co/Zn/Cd efflux system component
VLYKTLKEASHVEGVLETCDEHFWANSPGDFVGTLTVRCHLSADEGAVLERVTQMLSHFVSDLTIQVEKSKWETTSLS